MGEDAYHTAVFNHRQSTHSVPQHPPHSLSHQAIWDCRHDETGHHCANRQLIGSSRAQARTTLGREFPISALSMAERGPSPTIAHVSCALSKIPYGGFSPVRLQVEVSPRST